MADFAIIRWQLARDHLTSDAARSERRLRLKQCLDDRPQSAVCCWTVPGTVRAERSERSEPECKRRRSGAAGQPPTPAHIIAAHLAAAQPPTPAHIHIIAALRADELAGEKVDRACARSLIEEFNREVDLHAQAGC